MITKIQLNHLATDGTENGLTAAEKINKAIVVINEMNNELTGKVILTDGSVPFETGYTPTNDADAATKKYADDIVKKHADAEYIYYTNLKEINLTDADIQPKKELEMLKKVVGEMRDHSILIYTADTLEPNMLSNLPEDLYKTQIIPEKFTQEDIIIRITKVDQNDVIVEAFERNGSAGAAWVGSFNFVKQHEAWSGWKRIATNLDEANTMSNKKSISAILDIANLGTGYYQGNNVQQAPVQGEISIRAYKEADDKYRIFVTDSDQNTWSAYGDPKKLKTADFTLGGKFDTLWNTVAGLSDLIAYHYDNIEEAQVNRPDSCATNAISATNPAEMKKGAVMYPDKDGLWKKFDNIIHNDIFLYKGPSQNDPQRFTACRVAHLTDFNLGSPNHKLGEKVYASTKTGMVGFNGDREVGIITKVGQNMKYDWYFDPDQFNDTGYMQAWFNPGVDGGNLVKRIIDGTDEYNKDEYIVATSAGQYNFATGKADGTGVIVDLGDRVKYDGKAWQLQGAASKHNKGWFNPSIDGGGNSQWLTRHPVINGKSQVYDNGDYFISNANHLYDFRIGEAASAIGSTVGDVKMGDRIAFDGQNWIVLPATMGLMKGFFEPDQPGGGPWMVDGIIINGTTDYPPKTYVVAKVSGRYDFGTGKADKTGANKQAVDIKAGDRIYYNGITWEKVIEDQDATQRIFTRYKQAAHGFDMWTPVYLKDDGTGNFEWTRAKSDLKETLAEGVVTSVITTEEFEVTFHGQLEVPGHGLTPGQFYLSPTQEGIIDSTISKWPGAWLQKILKVKDANFVEIDVRGHHRIDDLPEYTGDGTYKIGETIEYQGQLWRVIKDMTKAGPKAPSDSIRLIGTKDAGRLIQSTTKENIKGYVPGGGSEHALFITEPWDVKKDHWYSIQYMGTIRVHNESQFYRLGMGPGHPWVSYGSMYQRDGNANYGHPAAFGGKFKATKTETLSFALYGQFLMGGGRHGELLYGGTQTITLFDLTASTALVELGATGGGSMSALDIKRKYEQNLDTNAFTDKLKHKLETFTGGYEGTFKTKAELEQAKPVSKEGGYAYIQPVPTKRAELAVWANNQWNIISGVGDPAEIKQAYESNPNTNALTDSLVAQIANHKHTLTDQKYIPTYNDGAGVIHPAHLEMKHPVMMLKDQVIPADPLKARNSKELLTIGTYFKGVEQVAKGYIDVQGKNEMVPGWAPVREQAVATKKYVDEHQMKSGVVFKDTWTPVPAKQYPLTAKLGDFYIISGLANPFTFTGGDLDGVSIDNMDGMIYDGLQWKKSEKVIDVDLSQYLVKDGTDFVDDLFKVKANTHNNNKNAEIELVNAQDGVNFITGTDSSGSKDSWSVGRLNPNTNNLRLESGEGHVKLSTTAPGKNIFWDNGKTEQRILTELDFASLMKTKGAITDVMDIKDPGIYHGVGILGVPIGGDTVITAKELANGEFYYRAVNKKYQDVKGFRTQIQTRVNWDRVSSAEMMTYHGSGAFDNTKITKADNYGMPAGTMPDPQTRKPNPNDIYIDDVTSSVTTIAVNAQSGMISGSTKYNYKRKYKFTLPNGSKAGDEFVIMQNMPNLQDRYKLTITEVDVNKVDVIYDITLNFVSSGWTRIDVESVSNGHANSRPFFEAFSTSWDKGSVGKGVLVGKLSGDLGSPQDYEVTITAERNTLDNIIFTAEKVPGSFATDRCAYVLEDLPSYNELSWHQPITQADFDTIKNDANKRFKGNCVYYIT